MTTPTEHAQLLRELANLVNELADELADGGYPGEAESAYDAQARARQAAAEIEGRRVPEPELAESIARVIYGSMRFDRIDTTADWQEGGNPLTTAAQDEARRCARAVLFRFGGGEVEGRRAPTDEDIYQFWENSPDLGFCTEPVKLIRAALARFGGGEAQS